MNYESSNFGWGFALGVVAAITFSIIAWHDFEEDCQRENNVYDCEWARTPFQPVEKEQ